ncbi:hypothetical protein HYW83_01620 [Candidatus Peregrinibacteria bacterium]|nr:hypothetical protein [Candidatus Peregrinibacteria bacterium]
MLKTKKAETILEVIIAVAVLMVILAPASALYIASIRTAATNRNDLVAAALAEEGIEIVRNIRDTNFIKFSDKIEDCWNTVPNHSGNDCAVNKIGNGPYRLEVNVYSTSPDYLKWTLAGVADGAVHNALHTYVDPVSGETKYDLIETNDEDYRLTLDEGDSPHTNLYYHYDPAAFPPGTPAPDPSPFYREITISYEPLTVPPAGDDAMKVISRVLYRTGITVRVIERVAFLTREPS